MCVWGGGGGGGGDQVTYSCFESSHYESAKKNQLPSVEVCLDHPLADTYKDKRLMNCLVQYWLVFCKP